MALKVQIAINSLRAELVKNAPDLIEKKLKLRWANLEEAEAHVRSGDVLVVMKRSRHQGENLALR